MAQLERDRLLLRLADQIVFRFTKLQDALGERLVPATRQRSVECFEEIGAAREIVAAHALWKDRIGKV